VSCQSVERVLCACTAPVECSAVEWRCLSENQCILSQQRCDGFYNCFDYSDEDDCRTLSHQLFSHQLITSSHLQRSQPLALITLSTTYCCCQISFVAILFLFFHSFYMKKSFYVLFLEIIIFIQVLCLSNY